ncbi:MAG TPA: DUF5050 domain-containing protein [Pyrinomonadaceae bacterium]|nr:DUF5050 domain-containing protein [Pyrinomonadaceae bacterium]
MTYQSHKTVSAFLAGVFGITILCMLAYTPSSGHVSYAISSSTLMACSRIAFDSTRDGNHEIYVMNADGTNQTRLTNSAANDARASISADGDRITFGSNRDGNYEIYVMNADGSGQTRLTNNPADDFIPNFSPDGRKIVFESVRDGSFEVYVMNADGTNQTRLTTNPARDGNPAFSPDGTRIVFESSRDGNSEIYVMNADGSGQTRLTNNPAEDGDPFFSPDSSKIAFETNRDGDFWEIYVMNADGTQPARLTNNTAHDTDPFFSPDGSKIAFETNRDSGFYEIYVMNADGTGQTNLSNSPEHDFSPSWSGCQPSPTPTPTPTPSPNPTPTGTVTHSYISSGSQSCESVAVIDTSIHTEVARIPMENEEQGTGGTPTELAITPDGRFIYVLRGADIGVVDTTTNVEVAAIPTPDGCGYDDTESHILMSPDGSRVYATSNGSGCESLAMIDTSTNTEIARIPMQNEEQGTGGPPTELAITPDGRFVYALRGADVGVVNTATNVEVAAIPTPDGCGYDNVTSHILMSPDGSRVYATSNGQSCESLAVIDTATNTEVARIPMENEEQGTGGTPTELAITPDGRFVYVLRGADVGVVDTTTNVEVAAIPTPDGCGYDNIKSHIVMSHDGSRVYATSNGSSCASLAVIDTATNIEIARIPMENEVQGTGGPPTELAITPDGRFIYVLRGADVGVVDTMMNVEVTAIPTPDGCGYDNVRSHIVMSPAGPVFSDADGDGIADLIDTGNGTFSDGTTSGTVVDAHGLQVRIEDVPSPSGVKIRIGPGLGQATFSLCASGYELQISPESEVVVTCGSITVKVVAGAARVRLSGDLAFVVVPQTTTVTIVNNSDGTYLVTNAAESSIAVVVTVDGVHTTISPGQQLLVSVDLTPPVITCTTNISVAGDVPGSCSAMVNPGVASATDNFSTVTVAGVRSDGQLLNAPYSLGTTTITWTATDAAGNQSSCQQLITVSNPNPVVTITGPPGGAIYAVGTSVNFSGTFTDNPGGTHSATWIFDNVTQSASVVEPYESIPGSANTTFTFTNSGVYLIRLVVDDGCGGTGVGETVDGLTAMIVVYDPSGGYVTGGGWINSPVGAYQPDPSLTGKANFGFVSRYQHGANVPTGQTEFQFRIANLNFHSTAYEWLVVAGARAQLKGTGTINGGGNYGFLLTAIDGSVGGSDGIDRFRIKIWDKDNNNAIVYDNKSGASDNSNSATDLGAGSIIIHQ